MRIPDGKCNYEADLREWRKPLPPARVSGLGKATLRKWVSIFRVYIEVMIVCYWSWRMCHLVGEYLNVKRCGSGAWLRARG